MYLFFRRDLPALSKLNWPIIPSSLDCWRCLSTRHSFFSKVKTNYAKNIKKDWNNLSFSSKVKSSTMSTPNKVSWINWINKSLMFKISRFMLILFLSILIQFKLRRAFTICKRNCNSFRLIGLVKYTLKFSTISKSSRIHKSGNAIWENWVPMKVKITTELLLIFGVKLKNYKPSMLELKKQF